MERRLAWTLPAVLLAAAAWAAPEPVSEAEQRELRMAVAPTPPSALAAARPAPLPQFRVEGVPPGGRLAGEAGPPSRGLSGANRWASAGFVSALALLLGLELRRYGDDR